MAHDLQENAVSIYLGRLGDHHENPSANFQPRHHDSNPTLRYPRLALDFEIQLSESIAAVYRSDGDGKWRETGALRDTAVSDGVLEARIPYHLLGIGPGDSVGFYIVLYHAGRVVEIVPSSGYVKLEIPT